MASPGPGEYAGRVAGRRVVFVVTTPLTADVLLRGQLRWFRDRGDEVTVIAGPGPELRRVAEREGVSAVEVPLEREISPRRDARALLALVRELRRLRPHVVHASTPKAGLLATLAATLARVPVRVYLLRGLRLETARGTTRRVLRACEQLSMGLAHQVLANSPSLRRAALEEGLVHPARIRVLGAGSSNGFDARRFVPRPAEGAPLDAEAGALRERLGLPAGAPVVGFVGRFTRDKGLADLLLAMDRLRLTHQQARLLLVGAPEEGDPLPTEVLARIEREPWIARPGFLLDTAPAYRLMDVLAFPSAREGLPNAPLEAAASEVPTVGYAVTGTTDAVQDTRTGTLVPPGDVAALAAALAHYLDDPARRRRHGQAARARVFEELRPERVWSLLDRELDRLLAEAWSPADRRRRLLTRLLRARALKRAVDVAVAGGALVALSPALLPLAGLVRLRLGSPVLFRQARPGLFGRPFTLMKLRTMTDARDASGRLLPDAERLTSFGRWLRSTSLDELPELVNVLLGDMSLVGPRPLLTQYLTRYSPEQARRHELRPGITGLAQVNGRNTLSWEEKFAHDVRYVDGQDLRLDLAILWRTLLTALRREGIAAPGAATMPEFQGSPPATGARATPPIQLPVPDPVEVLS